MLRPHFSRLVRRGRRNVLPSSPGAAPVYDLATAPMPQQQAWAKISPSAAPTLDPLFLCATRVSTFRQGNALTNASGFFFERGERLFMVTSRHVLIDSATNHFPDCVEIELHVDAGNLVRSIGYSVLLYEQGVPAWREGRDAGGAIDVAIVELDRRQLPQGVVMSAFTPAHLRTDFEVVAAGEPLLMVGFPLGFHDCLHHLPVVRHAALASSYGMRFQGQGYFLTDARTHRGTSGAPVVMRDAAASGSMVALPWRLLGVHSSRMDVGNRDPALDDSLGLNCAWYADILLSLTRDAMSGDFGPG
jgi:hypothetical protein